MIPLWIKLAYTAYVALLLPLYARKYGYGNFLWFSDIALIVTVPALWLESGLLASMMTLAILLPEAFWNVGFFGRLLFRRRFSGLTDYMFNAKLPRWLRALSLFHVFLPPLLLWMVAAYGYEPRALLAQTLVAWAVLPACYLLTKPRENINSVQRPDTGPLARVSRPVYVGLLMAGWPVVVYIPTHFLMIAAFG